jgi:nucleoside-diphosphate-sugar epimerase
MKKEILLTGASGFVGGAFWRRHRRRKDITITGLGRRSTGLENYIQVDLAEGMDVDLNPDIVIHTAARSSPWGSRQEFYRDNVQTTKNVLDFCRRRKVSKLIHISTAAVFYKWGDQLGINESSPIGPTFVNEYARSKYAAEQLVKNYEGTWCILRPRAVFGPGDTVLFPRILRAARKGKLIWIDCPNPPAMGDLVFIDSLSDYLLRASLDPKVVGEINLTNNSPVEIQAFLAKVFAQLELPNPKRRISRKNAWIIATLFEWIYRFLRIKTEPPITRFGVDVLSSSKTFNSNKCLQILGRPTVEIHEGLEKFIEWQKANSGQIVKEFE